MTAVTRGGITRKVLTGRAASSLQRYRDSCEDGQEPYLFSATRHCAHDAELQVAEWKAVREEHGTQGARRRPRATYETVDPETGLHASGQMGTHIKEFHSGRWRKRPVRDGEMPTHLRIEPEDLTPQKESEATHTIYAASAEIVNPDSLEDAERFFLAVKAERDELYSGLQESMWLERNGKSGLVHVHVASNATIYKDFTLGGVDYRAGQKMSGALTKVDAVRARSDRFLDEHPELGLSQSLARVGSAEYKDVQVRDGQRTYWAARRGKESNQDRIRREVGEALLDGSMTDRDAFVDEMRSRGVAVTEKGLRRGKPGKNHDYLFTVDGAKQGVSGRTLGVEYGYDAIGERLALKARGQDVEPNAARQRAGEPKPLPFLARPLSAEDQAELEKLRTAVERIAEGGRPTGLGGGQGISAPVPAPEPRFPEIERVEKDARETEEQQKAEEKERETSEATTETHVDEPSESSPKDERAPQASRTGARSTVRLGSYDRDHDLLVVDRGHRVRGRPQDPFVVVELDHRDPAAAGRTSLHLFHRDSEDVDPNRSALQRISAEQLEQIRAAAGPSTTRARDVDGELSAQVYSVRGWLVPDRRGHGLRLDTRAPLSQGRPVDAGILEAQQDHETDARSAARQKRQAAQQTMDETVSQQRDRSRRSGGMSL